MRAIDTNVLVRLLVRDDPKQARTADAFVAKGAWVSHVVLAEFVWVIESVHRASREQVETAVEMLLEHEHLALQDADVVVGALSYFSNGKADFTDCLILAAARKAGNLPLGTFDRRLSETQSTELLV